MHVRRGSALGPVALLVLAAGCNPVYFGVRVQDPNSQTNSAVLINDIDPGTPAATAGFEPNDVIVSFDHRGVTTVSQFRQVLAKIAINSQVNMKVYRSTTGTVVSANVDLLADENDVPTSLGINIRTSADPVGVELVSVEPDSVADDAGLLAGDVINKFGGTAIANVDQFRQALAQATENESITVTFRRGPSTTDDTTDVLIQIEVVSRQPLLGTTVQDLSAALAERLGYPALTGVPVVSVLIDGPGFDAGIMPRDTIFQYGGTKIEKVSDLTRAVRQQGGSGTVTVGYARAGDILTTDVTLRGRLSGSNYTLDVGLSLVDDEGSDGLLVVAVAGGSEAAVAELQVEDLILAVEGNPTPTPQEFYRQIDAALDVRPAIDGVSLSTERNGVAVSRFLRIRSETTSGGGDSEAKVRESAPYELLPAVPTNEDGL